MIHLSDDVALTFQPFLNNPSVLDWIHVMTYDFHGSWERTVGQNSPLYKSPVDHGDMAYFNVVSEGIYMFL